MRFTPDGGNEQGVATAMTLTSGHSSELKHRRSKQLTLNYDLSNSLEWPVVSSGRALVGRWTVSMFVPTLEYRHEKRPPNLS